MVDVHVSFEGKVLDENGQPTAQDVEERPRRQRKIDGFAVVKSLAKCRLDFYDPGSRMLEVEAYVDVAQYDNGDEGPPRVQLAFRLCRSPGDPVNVFRINAHEAKKMIEFVRKDEKFQSVVDALVRQHTDYIAESEARRRRKEEYLEKRRERLQQQAAQADDEPVRKTGKTAKKRGKQLADPC